MLQRRYGIVWMIVAWLALAALVGAAIYAGFHVAMLTAQQ